MIGWRECLHDLKKQNKKNIPLYGLIGVCIVSSASQTSKKISDKKGCFYDKITKTEVLVWDPAAHCKNLTWSVLFGNTRLNSGVSLPSLVANFKCVCYHKHTQQCSHCVYRYISARRWEVKGAVCRRCSGVQQCSWRLQPPCLTISCLV